MFKRLMLWAPAASLLGGLLLDGGCGWNPFGGNWYWITAWLNEDLFS